MTQAPWLTVSVSGKYIEEAACLCEEAATCNTSDGPARQVCGDEEGLAALVDGFDQGRCVLILAILHRASPLSQPSFRMSKPISQHC